MKYSILKYLLFSVLLGAAGCDMEESPKFPNSDDLFSTVDGANTVLNGCYSGLADFNYYGADFHHLGCFASGLFSSSKKDHYTDILAFNILPSLNYVENFWAGCYRTIARSNNIIKNLNERSLPDPDAQKNILGQAYFIRALSYFNLVRVYGGVPLITDFVDAENVYYPRSTEADVYQQVILDFEEAAKLLPTLESQSAGRPALYAAHMGLAKVYMTLASKPDQANAAELWQKAQDHAMVVYGKYTLVNNFNSLWMEATSDNTTESIFEIQGNVENTLRLYQLFTPTGGNISSTVWGRIRPNIECYDQHVERYPADPRIDATFLTSYVKYDKQQKPLPLVQTYPKFKARGNNDKSYPWLNKYYIKDHTRSNYYTTMNFVVWRYADLLLMLAEIENELNGPDNAYQYVNEVMLRARNSVEGSLQPADWSGMTQEEFRTNIMMEYRYELLGEGHEYFNERRRGWDYFKANVVDKHNTFPKYDFSKMGDVQLSDNPRVMLMPIPQTEIINNPNVTSEDQNIGY